jgi:hypothetical protein
LNRERLSPGRLFVVAILVVLATVVALGASLAVWLDRQLLNTSQWTKSSSQLLANQNIRDAVSNEIVVRIRRESRVDEELSKHLSSKAQSLASVGVTALQNVSATNISDFLTTKRAQRLWRQANRQAHSALVAVLESKGPVSASEGTVVLDLGPLLVASAQQMGVKKSLAERLNPAGKVVLTSSTELATAQDVVSGIRFFSLWLTVLAAVLYLLAVFLARGRRAGTVAACGTSLALVGLALVVFRLAVGSVVVETYVHDLSYRPAIKSAWLIETHLLVTIAIVLIVVGAVAMVGGLFTAYLGRRSTASRAEPAGL